MKKIILILVVVCLANAETNAQIDILKDTLHDDCAVCSNRSHLIIKPPYSTSFKKELPFILASGAIFGAGFLTASMGNAEPYTEAELLENPPDVNSINKFDRGAADNWSPKISNASDYVLFTTALLPAVFLTEHHTGRDISKLLIMYAEVFTINYGMTEMAKNMVGRSRPYVYNPEVSMASRTGPTSRKSFFSGHTSQTAAACFYFAKVIDDYHPTLKKGIKRGIWIFAATVPAVNGYMRVKAGKHFPTDIITGYIVGAATGIIVPQLHRTKHSKDLIDKLEMGFVPSFGGGMQMSLRLTY